MTRYRSTCPPRTGRRAVATMWLIAAMPVLLAMFMMVTDVATLWLARVELSNAVEAGALAGADAWGRGNDDAATRSAARLAAQAFAQANTVLGSTFTIGLNEDNAVCPNGSILLGRWVTSVLDTTTASPIPASQRACRVYAAVSAKSLWGTLGCSRTVQAQATARFDATSGKPRLVHLTSIQCP